MDALDEMEMEIKRSNPRIKRSNHNHAHMHTYLNQEIANHQIHVHNHRIYTHQQKPEKRMTVSIRKKAERLNMQHKKVTGNYTR